MRTEHSKATPLPVGRQAPARRPFGKMNAQTRMGFIHVFEVNNAADQGCPSGMVGY